MYSAAEYEPLFIDAHNIDTFRKDAGSHVYVDAFSRQVRELFLIDTPARAEEKKEEAYKSRAFDEYLQRMEGEFMHVYYPWNRHLVKTVGADDYFRLKTNRNQDIITADEQKKLYAYRVAVFGLSVGSNILFALTQSGISHEVIIADFDELDTTNLNRIMAGVHQIGLNKCVVSARHVYEDNPFASVTALIKGVDAYALEALLRNKKIDCIVDEVDDIAFKIKARILAMKHRVPIVMVTDNGDGVVLHVERYDLGCATIFGRKPSDMQEMIHGPLTKEQAGRFIMEMIVGGADKVDSAMLASVKRVLAHELVSWSQLGSAALLGGVVATYIIKHIALGKNEQTDIRAYLSPSSCKWSTHAD
ncbi:MAG: ThiF family adenylyltransferase [bacterium]|nr:ThiF family adenylyltransferase [bacterium]